MKMMMKLMNNCVITHLQSILEPFFAVRGTLAVLQPNYYEHDWGDKM
jgi:hypothetical protein